MSDYDHDYDDQQNGKRTYTYGQMAGMATKGMLIAKSAGADISFKQAFAPVVWYYGVWAGLIAFLFLGALLLQIGDLGNPNSHQETFGEADFMIKNYQYVTAFKGCQLNTMKCPGWDYSNHRPESREAMKFLIRRVWMHGHFPDAGDRRAHV